MNRPQRFDKAKLLSICSLFSGLSAWELKSIGQLMRLVEYKKDETVYREGENGNCFHVIVSGRMEAFVVQMDRKKTLAYLHRGDYFGEMSLLTEAPHSATIQALSDSLVLELKKEDFKKVIEHNATVSLELSRRLSARLKINDSRSRTLIKCDMISIFDPEKRAGTVDFSLNLAASLFHETHQKTVLVDLKGREAPLARFHDLPVGHADLSEDCIKKHSSGFDFLSLSHAPNAADSQALINLLNHLVSIYRFIIINLPPNADQTTFKALTQSDRALLVSGGHLNDLSQTRDFITELEKHHELSSDKIGVILYETVFGVRGTLAVKNEFFGQRRCFALPAPPSNQDNGEAYPNPLVVRDPDAEYSRHVRHVARFLSNNLVGLALGSGAAFGLAHVGVLKILEREKIPVDIIAGSSIGALVGSLYALHKNADSLEQAARTITGRLMFTRLVDFNIFPWRGILHGTQIEKHIRKYLGNKTFEDCRVALKIITANLSTRHVETVDTGLLTAAVRASIAIPAIFKPILRGGDVIVDGGILSPLPIRALRQAGAHKVIAVNVFPSVQDIAERRLILEDKTEKERVRVQRYGPLMKAGWWIKKTVLRRAFPSIFDILMMTIQSMEAEIADVESEEADVLLRPVLANASWVDLHKPKQFIQRGEEEAIKYLPKIKALVAQQNS